ncbi:hypothetical protein CfE428DRAFT_5802 [Chthoniobacter flavus Ellin428]|uniref:Uncharacterized protein n=1 Tax=Chthoniobacter flavus Ellin428 TaxID=497964 RepID=B4DA62_9BACT|nr:hypothetical protein [Chthoniobacter flavus]EDY16689.1 hypothetical protein CfE428DRAFT_5802 [Chthoniobacter flavus Ellin428]TCO87262.1 hypothetical protein EV701_12399 [Chthoniobacter flavus]
MTLEQHRHVQRVGRLALRGQMQLTTARRSIALICATGDAPISDLPSPISETESLADFSRRAAAAFESDLAPVRQAIVAALLAGDVAALKGLRALLPHLLQQVNADPTLADLLAHQLGKEVMAGLTEDPESEGMGERGNG